MDESNWVERIPEKKEGDYKTWKPTKEGEELIGIVKEIKTKVGKHESNVYVMTTGDGDMDVWGCKLLDDNISKDDIGKKLRILYKGDKPSPNGDYHDFGVYDEKPLEEIPVIQEGDDVSNVPF